MFIFCIAISTKYCGRCACRSCQSIPCSCTAKHLAGSSSIDGTIGDSLFFGFIIEVINHKCVVFLPKYDACAWFTDDLVTVI